MKVCVMCQGGNSRSVACGYLLKYEYGIDAVACSYERNSAETLKMLFDWSDAIIVMETYMTQHIPDPYKDKMYILDVGEDRWCNSLHPDLLAKLRPMLQKLVVPV